MQATKAKLSICDWSKIPKIFNIYYLAIKKKKKSLPTSGVCPCMNIYMWSVLFPVDEHASGRWVSLGIKLNCKCWEALRRRRGKEQELVGRNWHEEAGLKRELQGKP